MEHQMDADEAQKVVKASIEHRAMVDDVYPWWKTLRRPFSLLSIVIAALSLAVIFLASALDDIAEANRLTSERDKCAQILSNAIGEASARVRATSAATDNDGWTALGDFAETGSISAINLDELDQRIAESEEALAADTLRVQERAFWLSVGTPLPCPRLPNGEVLPGGMLDPFIPPPTTRPNS